ncbi:MAG: hypothetical protein KGD59_11230 [Candidatus Heimdallarchaeota archaeon]|nr:hypothetical protein [Candidatus Heimdallarchaeota archaeon]MBY8995114.1 hypothetical protein [Candidatus Heimdallarchaeota archaeon]
MSKKIRILMLINTIAAIILLSNIAAARAVAPGWSAGDIYVWGTNVTVLVKTFDEEEGLGSNMETITLGETEYNITAIDVLNLEYDAFYANSGGGGFINDRDYSAQDLVDDEMDFDDFFDVDYVWDYVNNVTVCNDFSAGINLNNRFLIEPNWVVLNTGFQNMCNGSELLDTLADPYEPIVYNYTLGDVLGAFSMKIMGKNKLSTAVSQFTDTKRKWTFEFDLGGYIQADYFNGTHTLYQAYDEYFISLEFEYTMEGVLDHYEVIYRGKITIDEFTSEIETRTVYALGGMKAASANFATFAAIGGLISTAIIAIFLKRKKK